MEIFVDIDGTICTLNKSANYKLTQPIQDRIRVINDLYDRGHTIVYWTARGSKTGIDWRPLTEKQLADWGCKYHRLETNKPYYDLLIDDRACNARILSKLYGGSECTQ